jgi:hypothetical protein
VIVFDNPFKANFEGRKAIAILQARARAKQFEEV